MRNYNSRIVIRDSLIPLLILAFVIPGLAAASLPEQLDRLIKAQDWFGLAAICEDSSHIAVATAFSGARALGLTVDGEGQRTYFIRFPGHAEIGKLLYTVGENKLSGLSVKKGVSSLKFIDSFTAYPLKDRLIRLGDAQITFKEGTVYQAQPFDTFFIFTGEWEFMVEPGNREERLTLLSQTGQQGLKLGSRVGSFVLDPAMFELKTSGDRLAPESLPQEALSALGLFREEWGHEVASLGEIWYLPFQPDFSAVLFSPDSKTTQYRYIYNPSALPDTSLLLTPKNIFLLFYNAREGIKLGTGSGNELKSMNLRLYFNPHNGYIAGSSELEFTEESGHKSFGLADGLLVKAKADDNNHSTYTLDGVYHLIGERISQVSVSYAGRLFGIKDVQKRSRSPYPGLISRPTDHVIVLSRDRPFYPNPGLNFFKSRVFVSSPQDITCLVSGELTSTRTEDGLTKSVFESAGLKDIVLLCGRFELRETIPGKIPIRLYAAKDLNLYEYFKKKDEIRDLFEFLIDHYPALPIPELNLLLSRGSDYGGISHPGLIHFNVVQTLFKDDSTLLRRIKADSPVVFHDINKDNLIHELSHQWWGGLISWKSYQDQWITEGLAQFSTLFHLEKTVSEKIFNRVLADTRRWVTRKSAAGPMVYGQRILNLVDDMNAFQSIVYNKAALVFFMFKEMLGEEAFLDRIAKLIENHRYQSLSSAHFIRIMVNGDPLMKRFFDGWVYSRIIPTLTHRLSIEGDRLMVHLRQEDSDFVFPLRLILKTAAGMETHTIVVTKAEQTIVISAKASILSADLDTVFSPIQFERK